MAAGSVLLAGVLSLTVSLEQRATGPFVDRLLDSGLLNVLVNDVRRHSMAVPDPRAATLARSWENAATADRDPLSPASVMEVRDAVTGYPQAHASYGMLDRVEQVIRQYPWPTLMTGIGLGFLLARRMRS